MNKAKLKAYAPQARKDFIAAVTARAHQIGLVEKNGSVEIAPAEKSGDFVIIAGQSWPAKISQQRANLIARIEKDGFAQTMEAVAYTWFNRFAALRYMEIHDYLSHGYRALSSREGGLPEILNAAPELAQNGGLPGLNAQRVIDLKLAGDKDGELYRLTLIAQCNALSKVMPFLFERIDNETELLLPDNLLLTDSVIAKLVEAIPEQDWQEVEIVGWLYQFYISEKKDQVIGKVVKSEDIPAATQLFTPNWIVQYLVQNSVGRLWSMANPASMLKSDWPYYIEPAEQTPEVQAQLDALIQSRMAEDGGSLNPETITVIDPACGSGHILVEAYDVLKAIYLERGYQLRSIPRLILEKNLYGLDIDDRAAQLAGFALLMKARADDRRLFDELPKLNVYSLQSSKNLNLPLLWRQLDLNRQGKIGTTSSLFDELQTDLVQVIDDSNYQLIKNTLALFEQAQTLGSLIQVPSEHAEPLKDLLAQLQALTIEGNNFQKIAATTLIPFIRQAVILAMQFDAVVANPPYMGSNFYNIILKQFIEKNYKLAKGDLYTCFIIRNSIFTKIDGILGMLTIPNWMFLTTFEDLRDWLFTEATVETFSHNGRGVFGSDFGSCAFTVRRSLISDFRGSYKRLFNKQGSVASNEELSKRFSVARIFSASTSDFKRIPGSPLVYWLSDDVRGIFSANKAIGSHVSSREGMTTADNDRFLRYWFENEYQSIGWGVTSEEDASFTGKKWFPYIKGGDYRKWYGNTELVVNWLNDGKEIKSNIDSRTGRVRSHNYNGDYAFKSGFTWTLISSGTTGARFIDAGFMFDANGPMAFSSEDIRYLCVSMINSTLGSELLKALSPTLAFKHGHILNLPLPEKSSLKIDLNSHVDELVSIARADWNLFECSWGFLQCTIFSDVHKVNNVASSFDNYRVWASVNSQRVRDLEIRINVSLAEVCGVSNEIDSNIGLDKVTLGANIYFRYAGDSSAADKEIRFREDTTKEIISYAIGCMMGRYSLDEPGLIYAHTGNIGFDPNRYNTFPADTDGIVPITDELWFEDDAANRLNEFLLAVWNAETLEENKAWLAESLGQKGNETPQETIRRYIAGSFYKNHLQTYKKRPIYWLFSSGKQGAFQALVYLHRYNESTLSRMRAEYVVPLTGKIQSRIDMLKKDAAVATSNAEKGKLGKDIDKLGKKYVELLSFDEKLRHYADLRIQLDLDDGVKVNYGKFGDLLAEVKAVTGGKDE